MGLLSTLAKHRSDEMDALKLKDRIAKLKHDDIVSESDRNSGKINQLEDEYEKKLNHSKIPMKVADDIHKLRHTMKSRIKKEEKNDRKCSSMESNARR